MAAEDHPRIRGEHVQMNRAIADGSWIIPAYAGSTAPLVRYEDIRPDHPRIRGEHIYSNLKVPEQGGSSPHTRGARRHLHGMGDRPRIIPAYAGSTASGRGIGAGGGDHPRIRGEHGAPGGGDLVV